MAHDVWTFALLSRLRPFREVDSVEVYLDVVERLLMPPKPTRVDEEVPPLALPAALDFLDAVWRNALGVPPLFARRSYQFDAKLAMSCATSDEFDSRMTALADALSNLQIPRQEREERSEVGPLVRLERFITEGLDVSPERVHEAVATLRAVVRVRARAQHSGGADEVVGAYRQLDIPFPPLDFGWTWQLVQRRAVAALDALREELQAADRALS